MSINKVLKNKDLHNSDINSLSYHFIKNRISEAQICAYDLLGYSDDVFYQRCVNDLIAILSSVKNRVSFTQEFLLNNENNKVLKNKDLHNSILI